MFNINFRKLCRFLVIICSFQILMVTIYYVYDARCFNFDYFMRNYIISWCASPSANCFQVTKWMYTNPHLQIDARNGTQARLITTILLLQRNLLLFSIREVNLKISNTLCAKWWANPLSISEIEKISIADNLNVTQYKLTFEAQPGRFPFESVVNVLKNYPNTSHPYVSDDFVLVSARRLDENWKSNSDADENLRSICLSPEELAMAESTTLEIRAKWNQTDPEHPNWPPNASAMVPDFLAVGELRNNYLKRPNRTEVFCGNSVKMLIFISSAPTHRERRNAIRTTFGGREYLYRYNVRLIFSFGKILNAKLQKDVDAEIKTYGDILQSSFTDHYQNQSLSELFVYNWLVTHCKEQRSSMPPWVLKADDDSFLNIPLLLRVAEVNRKAEIIGVLTACPANPWRKDKYYVPRYMYAAEYLFGFVFGGAALMQTVILEPLLKASLTCPVVNLCDVYITGILAKQIGVQPVNSELFQTSDVTREQNCSIPRFTVNTAIQNSEGVSVLWENLHKALPPDCKFDENLLLVDRLTRQKKLNCLYDFTSKPFNNRNFSLSPMPLINAAMI